MVIVAVAGGAQHLLVGGERGFCGCLLLTSFVAEDRDAVLRAEVVALAHALRRVVALPEELQHLLRSWWRGVESDEHASVWPVRPLQTSS